MFVLSTIVMLVVYFWANIDVLKLLELNSVTLFFLRRWISNLDFVFFFSVFRLLHTVSFFVFAVLSFKFRACSCAKFSCDQTADSGLSRDVLFYLQCRCCRSCQLFYLNCLGFNDDLITNVVICVLELFLLYFWIAQMIFILRPSQIAIPKRLIEFHFL